MRQQIGNGPQLYCKQPQLQGPSHQTTGIAPGEVCQDQDQGQGGTTTRHFNQHGLLADRDWSTARGS
ncbi:hypothetical protein OIU77_000704 [Salix suchowensis]|uniref:Uncharacterized protein n=1 Tax=Salix suchowensis TaxID=1278906 RepID=A0ABQ9B9I1_9ROSI|nr:hypothetical protein OIU77_000704 [Salix suchowensis]